MKTEEGFYVCVQFVRCKKESCSGCPHGPYFYGFQKVNGKTKKIYYGRTHPGGAEAGREAIEKWKKGRDERGVPFNRKPKSKKPPKEEEKPKSKKQEAPKPPPKAKATQEETEKERFKRHDAIFFNRTATCKLAREILGFSEIEVIDDKILKARFFKLASAAHPDRGGSVQRMKHINSAYEYLRKQIGHNR